MNILFKLTVAAMIGSLSLNAMEAPVPMADHNQTRPKATKIYFTRNEDNLLTQLVEEQQAKTGKNSVNFAPIAESFNQKALLNANINEKTERQLRERWKCYLDPTLNRSPWTTDEDAQIIQMHQEFGSQWAKMATCLSGRSANTIKNRWHFLTRQRKNNKNKVLAKRPLVLIPQPVVPIDILSPLLIENLLNHPKLPDIQDILDAKDDPFLILKPAI